MTAAIPGIAVLLFRFPAEGTSIQMTVDICN